jgi:N-acetylglucosaminyl-diphospho-decaprenol L-rhamnosyltransferase
LTLPITAIVVSYNSVAVLPLCIEALQERLAPDQLVVVDNASSDASAAVARDLGVEVIVNDVNAGFGAACNRGARIARNDLLMFINPDVRITSVSAAQLTELAAARPFGLLAPRALDVDEAGRQASCMRRILPWPCNIAREALGPVLPREFSLLLEATIDTPARHAWLSGALLLCARTEFLELGGFDERFFLYYEDQELSRRYTRHGLSLSITNAVAGCHTGGGSAGAKGVSRAIPRGASAISSIELVGIMHGFRAARRAWWLYRCLQRCATAVAWLSSKGKGPLSSRGAEKLIELRCTASATTTLLASSASHYPIVKALTRSMDRRSI